MCDCMGQSLGIQKIKKNYEELRLQKIKRGIKDIL
jgi:hypothetical protein